MNWNNSGGPDSPPSSFVWVPESATFCAMRVAPNTTATIFVPTSDPNHVTETGGAKPVKIQPTCAVYKVGSGRYSFTAKR